MSCGKTNKPVSKRLRTPNTVEQFEPFTGWMLATGTDTAKQVIKRKSVQLAGTAPTLAFKAAMQLAEVRTDNPGTWALIAGYGTFAGAGESNTGVMTLGATLEGSLWVRFGLSYTLGGTAPTDGQADVEVQTSVASCGRVVASATQQLVTFNTTANSYATVTGWIPTIDANQVVAGFVVSDLAGNFRCRLAVRYATTSIEDPGTWNLMETTCREANGEETTDELTVVGGDHMFCQFAVAYSQSTAGTPPGKATVSTTIAVRRT